MSRARIVALLAIVFAASCGREQSAPPPPFDAKAALASYLGGIYGAEAARGQAWTDGADDARVQRSVCAFGTTAGETRGRYLLAVCGEVLAGGHAMPGLIDFHVLEPTPSGFHPIELARDQGFGSDGQPGTVSLARLGRERGGFVVEEAWVGQGTVLGTRSVHEFRGGTVQPLATLRSELANGDGLDVTFAMSFDAAEPDADAYPLLVHETGRDCGTAVDRRHRIAFDAGTGRYPVPATLMREDCLRNSNPVSGVALP